MSMTLAIIAISYFAIIFLVLRTLHFVREKNLVDPEFYHLHPHDLKEDVLEVKCLN